MVAVHHIPRLWCNELTALVESAEHRLVIAAPFISAEGARCVSDVMRPSLRESGRVEILTDLSPTHVADGSLDPEAVIRLYCSASSATLWHLPRFHAKVYIADDTRAIVTSGNLTASALYRNVEYGVRFNDPGVIRDIQSHFDDFRAAGTAVVLGDLLAYAKVAADVRATTERQRKTVDPRLQLGSV